VEPSISRIRMVVTGELGSTVRGDDDDDTTLVVVVVVECGGDTLSVRTVLNT